jgi:hypothetical protein
MKRIFALTKVRNASIGRRSGNLHPVMPWRIFFRVLVMLALLMGSLSHTQAAQAATEIRFSMTAANLKRNTIVCVGEDVPIQVKVFRVEFTGNQMDNSQRVTGVLVKAEMWDASIGKMNPVQSSTSWSSNDPGGADFNFHTIKAGTTTISFGATIKTTSWLAKLGFSSAVKTDVATGEVTIKVEDCKFRVNALSHWVQVRTKFDALIRDGILTVDAQGNYTGTATVYWDITLDPAPGSKCKPQVFTSTSQVNLTGAKTEGGKKIIVDVEYQPAKLTWSGFRSDDCSKSFDELDMYTPAPLTIAFPVSGGFSKQTQVAVEVLSAALNMTGPVSVSVFPEPGR